MKQNFDIRQYKTEFEIISIVNSLGSQKLTPTSHTYEKHGDITILESSERSTQNYSDFARKRPAIALIEVVLAANRNYNKMVVPRIAYISKYNINTFDDLISYIETKSEADFYDFWKCKDAKKYRTLQGLLNSVKKLKRDFPDIKDDFDLMNRWASDAVLSNYNNDVIGELPNIAIATFQHLRMVFGIDTIKPDQRVKEVLREEFGLSKLNDENTILAVEQIAKITGKKVITIDQIFVKYGSGYYNQHSNRKQEKKFKKQIYAVNDIVKNLKENGVDTTIVSKSTNLPIDYINNL